MIIDRPELVASVVTWDEARSVVAELAQVDTDADFATSMAWCRAAIAARGLESYVPVVWQAAGAETLGCALFERGLADWRSGSPGSPTLRWPFAALGYGFRPLWRAEAPESLRQQWLQALALRFVGYRLELTRTDPEARTGDAPWLASRLRTKAGVATWRTESPASESAYRASLNRKHLKDLDYYRRRITRDGGRWHDAAVDPDATRALFATCLELHRARLDAKGKCSAYLAPDHTRFLLELTACVPSPSLCLTVLDFGDRPAAACLSFLHGRRYKAFMSGWDQEFHRYDLGRQVIWHQILGAYQRGLTEIDLLGGDLDYKREFGLAPAATKDLTVVPGRVAAVRQRVVDGMLTAYRGARGVLRHVTVETR